jgi:hypothetical protein
LRLLREGLTRVEVIGGLRGDFSINVRCERLGVRGLGFSVARYSGGRSDHPRTGDELKGVVFESFDVHFNRKRLSSTLGFRALGKSEQGPIYPFANKDGFGSQESMSPHSDIFPSGCCPPGGLPNCAESRAWSQFLHGPPFLRTQSGGSAGLATSS